MARPKNLDKVSPTVEQIQPAAAKPMVRPVQRPKTTARVRYKPTGKIMSMTIKQAQITVKQSPKNYEIIN